MNGTYTQRRRTQMAGGGITNARQGYFLGDLVRKIKDDIIPNELKNPLGIAALIGASTKIPGPTQGWLGDLLERAEDIPYIGPVAEGLGRAGEVISDIPGQIYEGVTGNEFDADNIIPSIISGITGAASPYFGTEGSRRVNPLYPLGIGAAVGKYVEGLPKDELPMDTTSIDPAAIAAAARGTDAEGAAAGLRFLPPQVTRAAEGGIMGRGYKDLLLRRRKRNPHIDFLDPPYIENPRRQIGEEKEYSPLSDQSKHQNLMQLVEMLEASGMEIEDALKAAQDYFGAEGFGRAQGGRIGFDAGGNYEAKIKELMDKGLSRELAEVMAMSELSSDHYDIEEKAQGGRIGYQEGGLMANMDMIALEFMQEFGYDMMLAKPEVREDFIQRWKEKNFYDKSEAPAEKRVMAQEGGLMNLGGMEKDYREEGGFVPIGGKEKADDVPARLSKNEFVFTADAVRGAGGGDIDKGAAIMEDLMKRLEGARGMFTNAQQLEKRII